MDYYPQDLLVGVFPLVFAVNAILNENPAEESSTPRTRSLFDRFLDAVAASLVDEGETTEVENTVDKRRSVSLFRPDDDESSDDDDDFELFGGARRRSSGSLSAGFYAGFGRRGLHLHQNAGGEHEHSNNNRASYAKALTHGQGFFQRARIESISNKHGFPPSKDPGGMENLAHVLPLFLKKDRDPKKLQNVFSQFPMDGILPAGWLEKHAHALPSVILVVCTVCASQKRQGEQDRHLFETIEHLRFSLVPKRQCKIHVIGLLEDNVTIAQGEGWIRAILNHSAFDNSNNEEHSRKRSSGAGSSDAVQVTLLRASSDLQANDTGLPTSLALRQLHQSVRDASLMYYLGQARRTKDKLSMLTEDKRRRGLELPPNQLLPLVIRYCFKIAIFYEFQWKHEKSLRFMVEAFRHTMKYYEYLLSLQRRPERNRSSKEASDRTNVNTAMASVADMGDSFEVALNENHSSNEDEDDEMWDSVVPLPPDDMIHQCRAVAEWLNLKLLQAGFASHTEGGLLAAANQWRQHCRLFCNTSPQRQRLPDEWFEWAYVARQRLVMSQLVERHPPKALGDLGNEYDEVLIRCSSWRTYESAVEATLRLAREVDKARPSCDNHDVGEKKDPMRARYVGGLDSDGLFPELREICKIDHRAKALELVMRAITLFEYELEKEKRGFFAEDKFRERSSSRSGARLHYLAGGILLGMERHQEAAVHLEKAAKFSRGWRELELSIRRMLIECYEKHVPSSSTETSAESSQAIVSMILDSYFNAEMSAHDLRRALGHFASMSGGESLKWYHEMVDEEDPNLPFSFAVTFPGTTHATAGSHVNASIFITSNLDYAVHVNSILLLSLAGNLPIPAMDLLCAANASEGSEGGIIIQSKTTIIISTELQLPKDTSIIAIDDSGNGGEMQGVAGKGSFAKSAKPRTAGITSAGGARLVSEEISPGSRASQGWSLRCLGGKPLLCDGMQIVFYPVQAEKATRSSETVTLIEVTIEKKKPKTAANIKRTPFEEENYIASAWSRPMHVPLSYGPRSLRVLGPMPEMLIQDITEEVTGGKALEGTVNRILLKLSAGPHEHCSNLRYRVSCFSVLITPSGSTKRLVSEEELTPESVGSIDMKNPSFRTPALVSLNRESLQPPTTTDYGYSLPEGWNMAGSGQAYDGSALPSLQDGESTFIQLNLFRPSSMTKSNTSSQDFVADDDNDNIGDASLCKTDFYVTLSYRQERRISNKMKRTSMRRSSRRRRPVMPLAQKPGATEEQHLTVEPSVEDQENKTDDKANESLFEEVSLEYTGSVVWGQALMATFSAGAKRCCPSGSRYQTNTVDETGIGMEVSDVQFSVVEGESFSTRCSLHPDTAVEGLKTEITEVSFEDNTIPESPFTLSLESASQDTLLYKPEPQDSCRILGAGSRLAVSYTVKPTLKGEANQTGVKALIGAIAVKWKPSSLPLPSEALGYASALPDINSHGPLRLEAPSTIRFSGPLCYVERSPFEAALESEPSAPRVAIPFEVNYRIKNRTEIDQIVSINVKDPSQEDNDGSGGLLFTGMTSGELSLAPSESQTFSYTLLATRAGTTRLPSLMISSERYKSWIIKEAARKEINIFP